MSTDNSIRVCTTHCSECGKLYRGYLDMSHAECHRKQFARAYVEHMKRYGEQIWKILLGPPEPEPPHPQTDKDFLVV